MKTYFKTIIALALVLSGVAGCGDDDDQNDAGPAGNTISANVNGEEWGPVEVVFAMNSGITTVSGVDGNLRTLGINFEQPLEVKTYVGGPDDIVLTYADTREGNVYTSLTGEVEVKVTQYEAAANNARPVLAGTFTGTLFNLTTGGKVEVKDGRFSVQ